MRGDGFLEEYPFGTEEMKTAEIYTTQEMDRTADVKPTRKAQNRCLDQLQKKLTN